MYNSLKEKVEKQEIKKEWNDAQIMTLSIKTNELSPKNKEYLFDILKLCYQDESAKIIGTATDNVIYDGKLVSNGIPGIQIDFQKLSKYALDIVNEFHIFIDNANRS